MQEAKLKKIIIIFSLLFGVFLYSDKIGPEEKIINPDSLPAPNFQLFLDFNTQWWKEYNNELLNETVSLSLRLNKNIKTVQSAVSQAGKYTVSRESYKDLSTVNMERVGSSDKEMRIIAGSNLNTGQLNIEVNKPLSTLNLINSLSSNKNLELKVYELQGAWVSQNLSVLSAKFYGYYVYLLEEEENLKERVKILEELEKMEELKVSLNRGTGEGLSEVRVVKEELAQLIQKNGENKKNTERSIESLFSNYKKDFSDLKGKINAEKKEFELKINDTISSQYQSDAVKNRADLSYYLEILSLNGEKIKIYGLSRYPNFWIDGSKEIKNPETLKSLSKINDSAYFISYNLMLDKSAKDSMKLTKDEKSMLDQYEKALLEAYNEAEVSMGKRAAALEAVQKDDVILKKQENILNTKKSKLEAGTVSKYEYLQTEYSFLTQKLYNSQLHFDQFIKEADVIYFLGGVDKLAK